MENGNGLTLADTGPVVDWRCKGTAGAMGTGHFLFWKGPALFSPHPLFHHAPSLKIHLYLYTYGTEYTEYIHLALDPWLPLIPNSSKTLCLHVFVVVENGVWLSQKSHHHCSQEPGKHLTIWHPFLSRAYPRGC